MSSGTPMAAMNRSWFAACSTAARIFGLLNGGCAWFSTSCACRLPEGRTVIVGSARSCAM